MSVSGVYANQRLLEDSYKALSSGKSINSAADNAAGLAISNKLTSQVNGYEVGIQNSQDMKNLLNTAEGGLAGMADSLQRLRELGVQAQNGILTSSDKQILQEEANQILENIKDYARNTEFNNIKLLDGNFADKNVASNPTGNGVKISIQNATLESLGLEGFDLTGDFDLSVIDGALSAVSDAQARIGAQSNALDHVISANEIAYINTEQARSNIQDADMARVIMDLNKANVLQQVQIFGMKAQMDMQQQKISLLA